MISSPVLNYTLMIILVIFFITLIRILTNGTDQLPRPSQLQTWATMLHYSCILVTMIIIYKLCVVGLFQEIVPYIITYILFIMMYIYGLYNVARFIVW